MRIILLVLDPGDGADRRLLPVGAGRSRSSRSASSPAPCRRGRTCRSSSLAIAGLVMAPTAAFFLWAWALKIKEQRKLAGTLPRMAGPAAHLARHRRPALHHRRLRRHVLHPEPGLRRPVRAMERAGGSIRRLDGRCAGAALLAALADGGIGARFVGGCVRDWVLGRPIERHRPRRRQAARDGDAGARGGRHQGRADRAEARHGDGDRRRPAVRAHDPAPRRRDRRPPRRRRLHRRLARGRRAAATSPSTRSTPIPTARSTTTFDGRADLAAGRVRFIGDPEQRIAEDRLRVLRFFRFHAWYGRPPFDGPGFDACRRNAATLSGLSGERVRKELLRTLDAPGAADAFDAMLEAGALDHWLPEYAGSDAAARAGRRARTKPDRAAPAGGDPAVDADATAIGKRLKLSTQESAAPAAHARSRRSPIDTANLRASLYRLGTKLFIDRAPARRARRLARRAGARRAPGRRRNCRSAAPMRWRSA